LLAFGFFDHSISYCQINWFFLSVLVVLTFSHSGFFDHSISYCQINWFFFSDLVFLTCSHSGFGGDIENFAWDRKALPLMVTFTGSDNSLTTPTIPTCTLGGTLLFLTALTYKRTHTHIHSHSSQRAVQLGTGNDERLE
jgi:hypothetical protein